MWMPTFPGPCRGTSPQVGCKPKGASGALFVGLACPSAMVLTRPAGRWPVQQSAMGGPQLATGPTLPSFDEIQASQTPTLRHIPKAARHLRGQAFTRCLASVVHHNDANAWQELLMLPKTVLDAPRRGGRQHQKAVASYTSDRLQRWQAGERQSL